MIKSKVQVKIKKSGYSIYIGEDLIDSFTVIINKLGQFSKYVIVTDSNVAKHHLKKVENSLKRTNTPFISIILKPGEKTKSFSHLNILLEKILHSKVDRNCILIALGGGVIGDLVGLAASILLRGVKYVQIPTTLLAQVDSSIGGKTGINSKYGKNLIGTFNQPLGVLTSINVLSSLNKREIYSGYAEILKYALIADEKFYSWLLINAQNVLRLDKQKCLKAIRRSCEIKSEIVSKDEKEKGIRAYLNLGHTFGHSIESISNYSKKINHGEAVFVGMLLALKFSNFLSLCESKIHLTYESHLKTLGIKYLIDDYNIQTNPEEFYEHMLFDKKITNGKLNFILLKNLGKPHIFELKNKKILTNFLRKEIF